MKPESIEWFIHVIRRLPSDDPVAKGHPGYNRYTTQKAHWLGWLDPNSGTGTYPRKDEAGRDASFVYNHIVEPQMLLWLVRAAGIKEELVQAAMQAADSVPAMSSKSAAIRKLIPWPEVASALAKFE